MLLILVSTLTFAQAVACYAADSPTNALPVRLGLFIGVDASTYSIDGSKFGLYEKYVDRELVTKVSSSDLARVVSRLTDAGLLDELPPSGPNGVMMFTTPPMSYEIRLQWPEHEFHCRWLHDLQCVGGCQVPEKYLNILDDVPASWKNKVLREFVDANRKLNKEANKQIR